MTIWIPDLADRPGPKYVAIVDALAEAVEDASLSAGERLPTHRDLAQGLGVTVGTVSRAYREAERRGLVIGEIGRGTFVAGREQQPDKLGAIRRIPDYHPRLLETSTDSSKPINLKVNTPAQPTHEMDLKRALHRLIDHPELTRMMEYMPEAGSLRHRQLAENWARWADLQGDEENIVITNGALHGCNVVLSSMLRPGDTILCDELTYPGLRFLANQLHLKLKTVPGDDQGMLPYELEAVCRSGAAQALYVMPTVHNPLTYVMPEERRRALAKIAEDYRILVIEDDVYGFLVEDRPPALCRFAPNVGFYINSASKLLTAGLRVGFIHAPKEYCPRLASGIRVTSFMTAPLNAEIVLNWIEDGTAEEYVRWHRAQAVERLAVIEKALAGYTYRSLPTAYHLWLELPDTWRGSDFVSAAQARGVLLNSADQFAVARGVLPDAIRICYGTEKDLGRVQQGMDVITTLLRNPNAAAGSIS